MEHYDLRVIEDCLVFSYEVECPNYPKETVDVPKTKLSKPTAVKKNKRMNIKKWMLHFLVVFLAPFALLADAAVYVATSSVRMVSMVFRGREKYIPVLGTFSCFVLLTTIFCFL